MLSLDARRLIASRDVQLRRRDAAALVERVLAGVPVPVESRSSMHPFIPVPHRLTVPRQAHACPPVPLAERSLISVPTQVEFRSRAVSL
jgi:hypothetical protein